MSPVAIICSAKRTGGTVKRNKHKICHSGVSKTAEEKISLRSNRNQSEQAHQNGQLEIAKMWLDLFLAIMWMSFVLVCL